MHTHRFFRTYILALAVITLPGTAMAQLGPQPSEIPSSPLVSDRPPSAAADSAVGASNSQRARPAIDEILLAQARQAQGEPTIRDRSPTPVADTIEGSGTLKEDLRSYETLPVASNSTAETLVDPNAGAEDSAPMLGLGVGWLQTVIALAGVLLLILGLSQFYKRLARTQGGLAGKIGAGGSAPSGILEVIGRYPISAGMTLVVLKFDRRVLLVSSSAATRGKHARGASMQTLCELSDPEDVASVLLKARSASGESIARSFERALQEADDMTDESIYAHQEPVRPSIRPRRSAAQVGQPNRTITSDEGDRAELWSSDADGQAAAGVLRRRLAAMRRETGA